MVTVRGILVLLISMSVLLDLPVCRCQNRQDFPCTEEASLRLVGGTGGHEGRVEICEGGQWGTVCDDLWDNDDAQVVCAQLGFQRTGAVGLLRAPFGQGFGTIHLDNVRCVGDEDRLVDCPHLTLHNCGHHEDAGVRCEEHACTNGDIRLQGGDNEREGRVEVCLNEDWGTVCDDLWGSNDAAVVCAQLGFSRNGARAFRRAQFGRGSGNIWLDDVACTGTEARLIDCTYDRGTGDCSHFEDAGVSCQEPLCTHGELRLIGGSTANEGRVEVCLNEEWGTVCDDSWSTSDAIVVCRQLGMSTRGAETVRSSVFGPGTGPIHLDNVACSGRELQLIDCPYDSHTADCVHAEDAGVRCTSCSHGDVRIGAEGRVSANEGRVEVCINNEWGTVCDDRWDAQDAGVVCGQLGFSRYNAVARALSAYGLSDLPIHIDEIRCTGSEDRIVDCSYQTTSDCSQFENAGIVCNTTLFCEDGAVQLAGGASAMEGRVEVCYNEEWGTVCDVGWSREDAAVVCSQLGYARNGVTLYSNAHFGQGSGDILLSNLACDGSEAALINCTHNGLGVTGSCTHADDAGVSCMAKVCSNWDLRLVGGQTEFEGRLEMCWNEEWGTVCDDFGDDDNARVACRQIGYSNTISATWFNRAHFGRGTGPIWLDDLRCVGTETSLRYCPANAIGRENCVHAEDAGIRCSQCVEGSTRLVGGASSNEGRVEVCLGGGWGTVCDDEWSDEAAAVVCRQLGLLTQGAMATHSSSFGRGEGLPILMDNVQCSSQEDRLVDCSYLDNTVDLHNCSADHSEDAGVICRRGPPGPPQSVTFSSVTAVMATLSWTHPVGSDHNQPVQHYTVSCNTPHLTVAGPSYVTTDNSTTTTTFEGLRPYTDYTCCVMGVARDGEGEPTCGSFQTQEAAPSAPPVITNGYATSSTSLNLMWTPPPEDQTNGRIRQYHVQITTLNSETLSYIVSDVRIGISALRPYYEYECTVAAMTTALGPFSAPVAVRTYSNIPSGPPQSIQASSSSPTTVDLNWDPPLLEHRNGIVTGYRIRLTVASNGDQQNVFTTNPSSYTVTSLLVYTRYIVNIAAVTVNGTGPYSIGYEVLTSEAAPSRPPRRLRAHITTPSSLELTWEPPAIQFRNGIIRGHSVLMTEVETGAERSVNTSIDSLSVVGLHPYYNYQFQVASYTVGLSPYRQTSVQMPEDAPSAPPQNVRVQVTIATHLLSASALVQWDSPPADQQNGVITSYRLTVTNGNGRVRLETTSLEHTFSSLPLNQEYVLNIAAQTSAGMGPDTQNVYFNTLTGIPSDPPRDFRVVPPITPRSLSFSWSPPPMSGQSTDILGYTLTLIEIITVQIFTYNVTGTSFTAHNLHPYYTYVCRVAAYTEGGEGPTTAAIVQRTEQDIPSGYPGSFEAMILSPREVQLSWSHLLPNETNGIIINYIVMVTGVQSDESYTVETTATQHTVTTLPYTTYMFTVAAATSVGVGPISTEVIVETPEDAPSDRPQNVTVEVLGSTSFRLTWQPPPPEFHHGEIDEYRISVVEAVTGQEEVYTSGTTDLTVNGRRAYTLYNCTVAAVTVDEGPFTAVLVVRTAEDAPSAPPENVRVTDRSSSTIRVEWDPPPVLNRNGIIRRYRVRVTNIPIPPRSTTEQFIVIQNLPANRDVYVIVAAVTVERGPYSDSVQTTTLEDIPSGPPTLIRPTKNSPTSLTLTWEPPLVPNGNIVSYEVILIECLTQRALTQTVSQGVAEWNGLHPYYEYKYSVAAATTVGLGPFSMNGTVQLDEAAPSSPPANIAVVANRTIATVTWDVLPLEAQNGEIRYYIVYLEDASQIDSSTTFTSSSESYNLIGLRPGNEYRVGVAAGTVETGPKSDYVEFTTLEDAPGVPTNLQATVIDSTSVSLSWAPPPEDQQNGDILHYAITVRQVSPATSREPLRFETTGLSFVVDSLHPSWIYEFGVAGVTSAGVGLFAETSATLLEAAPSSPPTGLLATSPTPTSLQLTWGPPPLDEQNGVITEYRIAITEIESGTTQSVSVSGSSRLYTQQGLRPYAMYKCTVSAFTVGAGPNASVTVQQPEDVPGSPTDLTVNHTSSTTTLLQWSPVPTHLHNGVITGYVVEATSPRDRQTYTIPSDVLEYELQHLRSFTTYTFSVAAKTSAGRGAAVSIASRTLLGAPSTAPTIGTVTRISATEIQVAWEPVFEEAGVPSPLTYLVRYRIIEPRRVTRNADDTSTIVEVREPGTVIGGLEPQLVYAVSVAAKNEMGVGEFSEEIVAQLFESSAFQVHLYGPIVCFPWIGTGIAEKINDITHSLSSNLRTYCNCLLSPKYIAQPTIKCGDHSTDRVIVEANLVSTNTTSSSQLRNLLQDWVFEEPTILVQGVQLRVAPCSVLPLEEGGEICPVSPTLPAVTDAIVTDETSAVSWPLIGGIAGGLVVLICASLTLIVIVVILKRRQKKRAQGRRTIRDLQQAYTITPSIETNGSAKQKEAEAEFKDDDHIYDEPSKYFEPPNMEPPPSYTTSMANFNERGAIGMKLDLVTPSINENRPLNSTNPTTSTMSPPEYRNVRRGAANGGPTADPEYAKLSSTAEGGATPGATAGYSQLDKTRMPTLHYNNVGTSGIATQNDYETLPTTGAMPTLDPAPPTTAYQPLLPPPREEVRDTPPSTQYQPLGAPAGYAVPRTTTAVTTSEPSGAVAMTTSGVPQPSLDGWTGMKGKTPNLEVIEQKLEQDPDYIEMKSPTL